MLTTVQITIEFYLFHVKFNVCMLVDVTDINSDTQYTCMYLKLEMYID